MQHLQRFTVSHLQGLIVGLQKELINYFHTKGTPFLITLQHRLCQANASPRQR